MKQHFEYFRELDGLRGIAILLVLLVHTGLLGIGWVGVQLFFVLSGYLISIQLFKIPHFDKKWFLKYFSNKITPTLTVSSSTGKIQK